MILESFTSLLRSQPHWYFELLVGAVEMLVVDVVIGVLVWPRLWKHVHRDVAASAHIEEE